jgi:dsRNA-specific ribonuclease
LKYPLQPYKILQFVGNSVLSFIIMDFYFKKSQPYASKYNPKELHIFRKEMMTNIF